MRHVFSVRVGPFGFRIDSDWRSPIAQLEKVYADYPAPEGGIADFALRLSAGRPWRRLFRPVVRIGGDHIPADGAAVPRVQALLAVQSGMSRQMAFGQPRYLLLRAAVVVRDGQAILLSGGMGTGKSTLAALLSLRGWRLMADAFALIDPVTGLVHAFPQPVILKKAGIATVAAEVPERRFGPVLVGTPEGTIRHLLPDPSTIAEMDRPARPAAILFPRYGLARAAHDVSPGEGLVRLTRASVNLAAFGERGREVLTGLANTLPVRAIDYPDTGCAIDQVEAAWARL